MIPKKQLEKEIEDLKKEQKELIEKYNLSKPYHATDIWELENVAEATLTQTEGFESLIKNVKNPYPIDVFPEIHEELLEEINQELMNKFEFPLDRLSAHLMRIARENLKEEILKKIKGDEK